MVRRNKNPEIWVGFLKRLTNIFNQVGSKFARIICHSKTILMNYNSSKRAKRENLLQLKFCEIDSYRLDAPILPTLDILRTNLTNSSPHENILMSYVMLASFMKFKTISNFSFKNGHLIRLWNLYKEVSIFK